MRCTAVPASITGASITSVTSVPACFSLDRTRPMAGCIYTPKIEAGGKRMSSKMPWRISQYARLKSVIFEIEHI